MESVKDFFKLQKKKDTLEKQLWKVDTRLEETLYKIKDEICEKCPVLWVLIYTDFPSNIGIDIGPFLTEDAAKNFQENEERETYCIERNSKDLPMYVLLKIPGLFNSYNRNKIMKTIYQYDV